MKLNDTYKTLILVLVGVVVAVFSIMYVAMPNYNTVTSINSEITQLQQRLTELQGKQANRDQYLADTEKFQAEYDEVMASFPADLNQESTIMFLEGIKENNEFSISALNLGEEEAFYTLGISGGDVALSGSDTTGATTQAASTEATTQATTTEATTQAATTDGTLTEEPAESANDVCYRASFPISYYGSYSSLKDVLQYVEDYKDRMTIDSLNIAYDAENDSYSGDLELFCYAIKGPDRAESSMELNDVETGVSNIFNGGDGAGSSSSDSSLNKYDENDGQALVTNYDFYVMLNPSTSDVSAKVVGQNGAGKDASVVSNSDNTVSNLSYTFYEKDGKNYCDYDLDGTKYTAEVTSAEDIKLLIQSTNRKDGDDKVGVRVTIKNDTKIPVYVKVSGDDTTDSRVNIASRTGSVKVYK